MMQRLSPILNVKLRLKINLPLRLVLVVPFVLQITAAVGLTGWVSFRNGEKAVQDLANQLRGEISARIHQEIGNYLQAPRTIAKINANAIRLGQLNLSGFTSLTQQFWFQRDLFQPVVVSAIYFGAADGEFIGLGFQNDNTWQISHVAQSTGGKFHSYRVQGEGLPGDLLSVGGDYDPRLRPWYRKGVAEGKSIWSDIYVDFKDPRLKVTLVEPIYREDGALRGVLGVDFVLSHIRQFLASLKIGKSGQTFIVERSGLLVASSTLQQPFVLVGNQVERLLAVDVDDLLLRETARYLQGRFGDWQGIKRAEQLDFIVNGERYFLQVVPFVDGENLEWLIVVVVPEADFMERIRANTVMTFWLCVVALLIAIVVGGLTAQWITQPIWRLSKASRAIAQGDFEQEVDIQRQDELGILATAFNQMTAEIKTSQAQLADYSRSLEIKVRDRTLELQQEKEKSEELLLNILPQKIAERLKHDQTAIADYFDEVTILFADIVGFTPLASRLSPIALVNLLNQIFSKFDHLVDQHGLEKIKTIGDAYMIVGGLPKHRPDHADAVAEIALAMQTTINGIQADLGESLEIRIGINTGPVVAGVIGIKKFIYDLWGDTVNVASRMESSGIAGKIQVTVNTYELLKAKYLFEPRGLIEVKGKGEMMTYWLISRQPSM